MFLQLEAILKPTCKNVWKTIFGLQSQCIKIWYFQWKLMAKYTFKYMDFEKPKLIYTNLRFGSLSGKGASILNTLKTVANLRFYSQKDIHVYILSQKWQENVTKIGNPNMCKLGFIHLFSLLVIGHKCMLIRWLLILYIYYRTLKFVKGYLFLFFNWSLFLEAVISLLWFDNVLIMTYRVIFLSS